MNKLKLLGTGLLTLFFMSLNIYATTETVVENPTTSDNIVLFFILGIISIIGLGLFNIKLYMTNMSKN